MIKLIAFLGNPGQKYKNNRHNAGQLLAQSMPFYPLLSWQKKHKGLYTYYEGSHLIIPESYMNNSGVSIQTAASFYKIPVEEILIVHDELELPLGCLSLKFSGGLGGHNGLRSIRECFGSVDFWRLRIGIGRPDSEFSSVYDWVLSDFSKTEEELLNAALKTGVELLQQVLTMEPDSLLKEWTKKKIKLPEHHEEKGDDGDNK